MSSAAERLDDTVIQCVTFTLGEETYGIDVMRVQEVLRMSDIAPVPSAPPFVVGIINLRGNVVTVIDARGRLGLPAKAPDDATRIVILETARHVVGLLVDGVTEVVEFPRSEIEATPNVGEEGGPYIEGVFARDDDLLILLDLNRFLVEDEIG